MLKNIPVPQVTVKIIQRVRGKKKKTCQQGASKDYYPLNPIRQRFRKKTVAAKEAKEIGSI